MYAFVYAIGTNSNFFFLTMFRSDIYELDERMYRELFLSVV